MSIADARRKIHVIRTIRNRLQEQFEIAEREGFDMLAYLIEMAIMEVDTVETSLGGGPA